MGSVIAPRLRPSTAVCGFYHTVRSTPLALQRAPFGRLLPNLQVCEKEAGERAGVKAPSARSQTPAVRAFPGFSKGVVRTAFYGNWGHCHAFLPAFLRAARIPKGVVPQIPASFRVSCLETPGAAPVAPHPHQMVGK